MQKYCAVKILTVHATEGHINGHLLELDIVEAITRLKRALRLPVLRDHFEITGPHGRHLCMVLPVLSTDISSFRRSAPTKKLGLPAVKIIIAQVLEALVNLHALHIIHTGQWMR
jgi:serine/threonine-protein kinase SRPK3